MIMFDPPSGWRYGFPVPLPREAVGDDDKLTAILLAKGYPEEDIPLALRYSRYWERTQDDVNG